METLRKIVLSVVNFCLLTANLAAMAITNGREVDPEDHRSIVKIENTSQNTMGTGVVISPGLVLTAEHVVVGSKGGLRINGEPIAGRVFYDRKRELGDGEAAMDLALVEISDKTLPAMPFVLGGLPARTSLPVTLIGYGTKYKTTTPFNFEEDSSVVLRMGQNTLELPESYADDLSIRLTFEQGVHNETQPAGAMPGDSGGPLLHDGHVIGIASQSSFGLMGYMSLLSR